MPIVFYHSVIHSLGFFICQQSVGEQAGEHFSVHAWVVNLKKVARIKASESMQRSKYLITKFKRWCLG